VLAGRNWVAENDRSGAVRYNDGIATAVQNRLQEFLLLKRGALGALVSDEFTIQEPKEQKQCQEYEDRSQDIHPGGTGIALGDFRGSEIQQGSFHILKNSDQV